jgi:hypothetical protein
MHPDLRVPRRVFFQSYHLYLQADENWRKARRYAAAYVPDAAGKTVWQIGTPRSHLRHLYDARNHALESMIVARIKLERAKARAAGHVAGAPLRVQMATLRITHVAADTRA